jgi:hypothetical protein
VQELVAQLHRDSATINQERAVSWQALWCEPIPFSERLALLEPPSLPIWPPLLSRISLGVAAGLLIGAVVRLFRRRLKLFLRIAACGLARTPKEEDESVTHYRLQLAIRCAVMGILFAIARSSGGSNPASYRTSMNGESSLSL